MSHNLCTGICALFYGELGTGKTESVKQIARKTGRDVYHVDISESKSHWYGDSEKCIKKIFTDYTEQCKAATEKNKPLPILLFNEADGILSKRKNILDSNISQTENAMQNIILENLEKFEGVMIATTNLEQSQALELASTFNFSGGEIENISRKLVMNEVISGKQSAFDEIKMFCEKEKLSNENNRHIGFGQ